MRAKPSENVVYILGAGFSAEFGLPVMSNFLEKSKDMYSYSQVKPPLPKLSGVNFENFSAVYDKRRKLAECMCYYEADLLNIEEILSLLDMDQLVDGGEETGVDFRRFIADVIKYYTPAPPADISTLEGYEHLKNFILRLFRRDINELTMGSIDNSAPNYAVLSFNYDRILEDSLNKIFENFSNNYFNFSDCCCTSTDHYIPLIKIHGDVENPESIVAPTWRKNFSFEDASNPWRLAGEILKKANHIRIIGYSLPVTDSYLKYFLKWSTIHDQNLKSIDVICLDDAKQSIEKRYRDFIRFPKFKFHNKSTGEYLEEISIGIEKAHENLFGEHTKKTATLGTGYFPRSF